MAQRKLEDERFALFSEAAVVFLDLPDAVFRGYEGDEQLLGRVRPGDAAPITLLAQEIARLEPQHVYFPLGIGSHVDHQLARKVGAALSVVWLFCVGSYFFAAMALPLSWVAVRSANFLLGGGDQAVCALVNYRLATDSCRTQFAGRPGKVVGRARPGTPQGQR